MVVKRRLLAALVGLLLLLTGLPVQAHGYIVRALPANRAVLIKPPARLQYWFSEPLETRFSAIHLRDASGNILLSQPADPATPTLLTLQIPPGTLPDGAYIVELQAAFASDGHAAIESYVFYVGEEIAGVTGQAREDTARPLEVIWKALLLGATFVLFGTFTLYAAVFVPAWGSASYPAGLLPPRVMQRLNWIVWSGIAAAVAANILALIQQTMVFFNVDAVTVITGGLWQVVRGGSRTGDVWTLRMLLLVLLIIAHSASRYYRDAYPGTVRAFWTASIWLVALLIGTQAVISHAAGSFVLPWVAMLVHWLHSMSVAFWVGGLVVLALVLPVALSPYSGDERRAALLPVMQHFSRLMTAIIGLVIVTGIYNATNWFFTPADLATNYGTSLALKLLLVAMLLPIAALHHAALRPALTVKLAHTLRPVTALVRAAAHFTTTLRLEGIIALVTLAAAALLSATPVPEPEFARQEAILLTDTQSIGDFDITLTLTPGAPRINTFDVVVQRGGANVTGADVQIQLVNPAKDWRSGWLPADAVDDGLYVAAADAIKETGIWWTLVDVRIGDSDALTRAFFAWNITSEAAVLQSQPPSLFGLLALAAVIAVVLYLIYPLAKRATIALHVTPTTLIIVIGTTLITIVMLGIAFWALQEQQRQIEADLLPPPAIINHVPPDAASLARGEIVFLAQCRAWEDAPDYVVLVRSLPVLRDEALYRIPTDGWRSVPPCEQALNEQEAWDVVNFLRTQREQ